MIVALGIGLTAVGLSLPACSASLAILGALLLLLPFLWPRIQRARVLRLHPRLRQVHLLEGLLRRLWRTRHREALVLRGGILLRQYCPSTARVPADLDFLGQ